MITWNWVVAEAIPELSVSLCLNLCQWEALKSRKICWISTVSTLCSIEQWETLPIRLQTLVPRNEDRHHNTTLNTAISFPHTNNLEFRTISAFHCNSVPIHCTHRIQKAIPVVAASRGDPSARSDEQRHFLFHSPINHTYQRSFGSLKPENVGLHESHWERM
jgi:hypothetical protein